MKNSPTSFVFIFCLLFLIGCEINEVSKEGNPSLSVTQTLNPGQRWKIQDPRFKGLSLTLSSTMESSKEVTVRVLPGSEGSTRSVLNHDKKALSPKYALEARNTSDNDMSPAEILMQIPLDKNMQGQKVTASVSIGQSHRELEINTDGSTVEHTEVVSTQGVTSQQTGLRSLFRRAAQTTQAASEHTVQINSHTSSEITGYRFYCRTDDNTWLCPTKLEKVGPGNKTSDWKCPNWWFRASDKETIVEGYRAKLGQMETKNQCHPRNRRKEAPILKEYYEPTLYATCDKTKKTRIRVNREGIVDSYPINCEKGGRKIVWGKRPIAEPLEATISSYTYKWDLASRWVLSSYGNDCSVPFNRNNPIRLMIDHQNPGKIHLCLRQLPSITFQTHGLSEGMYVKRALHGYDDGFESIKKQLGSTETYEYIPPYFSTDETSGGELQQVVFRLENRVQQKFKAQLEVGGTKSEFFPINKRLGDSRVTLMEYKNASLSCKGELRSYCLLTVRTHGQMEAPEAPVRIHFYPDVDTDFHQLAFQLSVRDESKQVDNVKKAEVRIDYGDALGLRGFGSRAVIGSDPVAIAYYLSPNESGIVELNANIVGHPQRTFLGFRPEGEQKWIERFNAIKISQTRGSDNNIHYKYRLEFKLDQDYPKYDASIPQGLSLVAVFVNTGENPDRPDYPGIDPEPFPGAEGTCLAVCIPNDPFHPGSAGTYMLSTEIAFQCGPQTLCRIANGEACKPAKNSQNQFLLKKITKPCDPVI